MRVLFLTNYPAPYRVAFFRELGKRCDLTVAFMEKPEEQQHRSKLWFDVEYSNFRAVFLEHPVRLGNAVFFRDAIRLLQEGFDHIILCGYASATQMLAIEYLRWKRIPYLLEADGALLKEESPAKRAVKRHFVSGAAGWISSGKTTDAYFLRYGAKKERIFRYPFTSLFEDSILPQPPCKEEKERLRAKLDLHGEKIVLSIGQMIRRKGFDILIRAAAKCREARFYIVGGEPTDEYLRLREQLGALNVRFLPFVKPALLAEYYQASDLFALSTREDIWGLVVNEAMANGLPVVTTDRCVAGLELVEDGKNGCLVPVEDPDATASAIKAVLNGDTARRMGAASLEKIRDYTIENMANRHFEIFMSMERNHETGV